MKRRTLLLAAAGLLCLAGAARGAYLFGRSRTLQAFGRIVARVETARPVLALTLDDGPTKAAMDEVLRALETRGVRATFFVNGVHLERAPELGRRLVAAGHELGNHTYSHPRMVLRSPAFIRSEVERTDALIRAAGHSGEIYFRPPFGWKLLGLPWYLWRAGRTTVTWEIDADPPPIGKDPQRIVAECLRAARPGAIILMHPWYPSRAPTRAALPAIIDGLRARGYTFVTVGELLGSVAGDSSANGGRSR